MDLGAKVKARREALGMSQEDLALKMGYKSRTSINKIENGRAVSQKIIYRLSQALDVEISYLMDWDKDKISNSDDIIEDTGNFHARILCDSELLDVIEIYYSLDEREQEIVRNFIKSLKKEA